MKQSTSSGFTIIELLLTIAIIGIIAVFTILNVYHSREQAKDAKRVNDFQKLHKAIELYYTFHDEYPPQKTAGNWDCGECGGSNYTPDFLEDLVPEYIGEIPHDPDTPASGRFAPSETWHGYNYGRSSDGLDYKLLIYQTANNWLLEPSLIDPRRDGGADPCELDGSSPWAWAAFSPAMKCT